MMIANRQQIGTRPGTNAGMDSKNPKQHGLGGLGAAFLR
jgi:hypothetical protein